MIYFTQLYSGEPKIGDVVKHVGWKAKITSIGVRRESSVIDSSAEQPEIVPGKPTAWKKLRIYEWDIEIDDPEGSPIYRNRKDAPERLCLGHERLRESERNAEREEANDG